MKSVLILLGGWIVFNVATGILITTMYWWFNDAE